MRSCRSVRPVNREPFFSARSAVFAVDGPMWLAPAPHGGYDCLPTPRPAPPFAAMFLPLQATVFLSLYTPVTQARTVLLVCHHGTTGAETAYDARRIIASQS